MKPGRPPKVLTPAELELARALHADGAGYRTIALAVSRARGAFEVADPARRKALSVSHMHIRRVLAARAGTGVAE